MCSATINLKAGPLQNRVDGGKQQGWRDELICQIMAVAADWRTGASVHQPIGSRSAAGNGIAEAALIAEQH